MLSEISYLKKQKLSYVLTDIQTNTESTKNINSTREISKLGNKASQVTVGIPVLCLTICLLYYIIFFLLLYFSWCNTFIYQKVKL